MPQIQKLDSALINKIAAGEVVERPASVVKELVENSIDAQASHITVEIREGGLSLIRVTDDGCGIESSQLELAFLRHATSKISSVETLENVLTLGFRGEALASIAGVSQTEVVSRSANEEIGAKIEIHGGEIFSRAEAARPVGTTFSVKNLFFNIPARRKFLKSTAAEAASVGDCVSKLALSCPHISFKYINNSQVSMQTTGKGLKDAIFEVYGKEAAEKLLKICGKTVGISIDGFLSRPEFSRANRQYCNFFINGRAIKSPLLQSAIDEAYRGRLMTGRFPVFAIHIKINPQLIDVNVHPAKTEIRFSDEQTIFSLMKECALKALSADISVPKYPVSEKVIPQVPEKRHILNSKPYQAVPTNDAPIIDYMPPKETKYLPKEIAAVPLFREKTEKQTLCVAEPHNNNGFEKPAETIRPLFYNYKIIGRVFSDYWLIEQNNSVYLIDQHAAHERILFEKFSEKICSESVPRQKLLVPVVIPLSASDRVIVSENITVFERIGFELESFGDEGFAITAAPYIFKNISDFSSFNEIIEILCSNGQPNDYLFDKIAMTACKAAVRSGDAIGEVEVRVMISRLLEMKNPFSCPHGRPTIVEIEKYEFEKMFKRK
ncbi:MAG: DNA mismatch repair endonuclease MutL [Clostridiales bacterium]|jgi:DNA mismatch repair protein MutL|nr:DNA mismatch repair endonuclease MutL [Clostridiales bacterium]